MGYDLSSGLANESQTTIDFKRIAFQALRYWYLVVISLLLFITLAYYVNRYTQRIYPVVATVIITEKEETSGAEILYNNAIVDQYRNYLNEPYILRSYPLVQRVVEDLNFDVAFYREGYILTSEAYDGLPLSVRLIRDKPVQPAQYVFKILTPTTFSLASSSQRKEIGEYRLGQKVEIDNNQFIVDRIPNSSINEHINVPYLLSIEDSYNVASGYVGKLDIGWAEEGAGVLSIKVNGPIPKKEIDFINGLITSYQKADLERKNQTADKTVIFIREQLKKMTDSLRMIEGQLQQFKKDNRTSGNLEAEAENVFIKIEALEVQRAELLMKDKYYEYLKKYIQESKNLEQVILPSSFGVSDQVISTLINKIVDLQLELKLFIDREKSTNPLVTNRLNRLNELKREILESVQGLKSTDKIKLGFLNERLADFEKQIGYFPLATRQLVSIRRNYSLLENLYIFLMQKMSEAEISKASSASDIVVVNPPVQSGGAITPKVFQNYALAIFFGLGFPFLIFVLIELLNTRIQSKEDIHKVTNIPFIGGIGHKKSPNNLEVLNSPKSAIAESFRSLRSNLNYFLGQKNNAVFLVSSSISGEGKTFTSVNLASIVALSGKRTLLIGADMRKPKIYQDFELTNNVGLSTYLSDLNSFDEVVQPTKNPLLDVVSGGPVPPNPSELLLTNRMAQLIEEAKLLYDFIVIDTPPMAIVTDAFVLATYADHTLFIIRQNYTPKALVKATNDFYASGKIRNISIVLNDIYKSGLGYGYGGYGYNSYGYGYGYGKKKDGYGYYQDN